MLVMYADDQRSHYNSSLSAENVYFEYAPIESGIPGALIPLSNDAAGNFGKALVAMAKVEVGGFIPENLLYCGLGNNDPSLIWYTAPETKRILYNVTGFPAKMKFNMPWLVWYYHRNHLYLFAAKEKPNKNTKLFHAPFGNITSGFVCLGSGTAILNKNYSSFEELIKLVELAFYGTKFTHLSETRVIKGNLLSLQKKLDGTNKPFPLDVLISNRKTIKNLIDGKESEEDDED